MAAFTSGEDAVIIAVAYYEKDHQTGENFPRWAARKAKELLSIGYMRDVAGLVPSSGMHHYRLTDLGNQYVGELLHGEDHNPIHIPGYDFDELREQNQDIKERTLRGAVSIALPSHYRE